MKYTITLTLLIWFIGLGYAQNRPFTTFRDYLRAASNPDSLKKTEGSISLNLHSSQSLHLLIATALGKQNAYDTINKQKVKQIIQLASKQKSQLDLAMAYYILGREYTIDQEDSLSYSYLTKAEKIFTAEKDTTGIIHCSKLLRVHTRRTDQNLSKFYFDRIVALGQQSKYPIDNYMYYLLIMACDPYFDTQPTERQMEDALQKTLSIIDKYPYFEYIRANVYKNIQEGYLRKKKYDKMLEFALKVMNHTTKRIDFMDYQYLGNACILLKKYDRAIVALEEAAKRIRIERPKALIRQRNIYNYLKKAYYEVGNLKASIQADETYDSLENVIRNNDRIVALFHLREKYSFTEKEAELKRISLEKQIVESRNELLKAQYDAEKREAALRNLALENQATESKTKLLQSQIEVQKQESAIHLAESQKQLLFTGLLVALGLIGTILVFAIKLRKTNTRLLELQQGRDKFYTIIAHDLRSPINSLNDMGIVLGHLIQEGKKQELDKVIQQIENMRQKTQLLLNNLFEWGKSQYFTPDVEEAGQPTDVVPLLRELYQTYLPFAEAKKITMVAELPSRSVRSVAPGGLLMTVRNLLDNALKNTPAGGQIKIEMSESSADNPAQSLSKLTITDTGNGIAPDQLNYLQQVFAGKIKPEVGIHGLGLGMVLIHHFVQKNKAALTVESEVGKGTCFRLMLEA